MWSNPNAAQTSWGLLRPELGQPGHLTGMAKIGKIMWLSWSSVDGPSTRYFGEENKC